MISLLTLSLALASAELPSQLLRGRGCVSQELRGQKSSGVVCVSSGAVCKSSYQHIQYIEVLTANLEVNKQFYIHDHDNVYHVERTVKIRFVQDPKKFGYRDGEALYLGQTEDRRDRFLISLVNPLRSTPSPRLDIYVKMAGRQYESTGVTLVP